jgi:hypothetical protein
MAEINLITGDLTVSGATTFLGSTYIPSGYVTVVSPVTRSSINQARAFNIVYLKNNGTITYSPLDPLATGVKLYLEITDSNYDQFSNHIRTQKLSIETGNQANVWREAYNTSFMNSSGFIVPYSSVNGPTYLRPKFKLMTLSERIDHIENSGTFALMPNEKIGFGTYEPSEKVHVNGNLRVQNTGFFKKLVVNNKEVNIAGAGFLLRDRNTSSLIDSALI